METELMISLEANPGPAPEWLQLLPLGEVSLGDGRASFSVDQEALEAMVRHFQARGLDLVIDYENDKTSRQNIVNRIQEMKHHNHRIYTVNIKRLKTRSPIIVCCLLCAVYCLRFTVY